MILTNNTFWDEKWKNIHDITRITTFKWMRNYLYHRLDKVLKKELMINADYSFLEVGCGLGRWLLYFNKKFGYRVSGIDFSQEGCILAQNVLEKSGITSKIYLGDIFNFKQETFDIVFSDGFIEHFSDINKTLSHISSLVKDSGYLVSIIPNLTGFQGYLLSHYAKKDEILKNHKIITKELLINSYRNLKFDNIKFYELGSVIPKVFALPRIYSIILNIILMLIDLLGIHLEGENISSTYLIIGKKNEKN